MPDVLAGLAVLAALGSAILAARRLRRRVDAEWSRKIVHLTMGCVAMSFPFIFHHRGSVVVLGLCAIAALLALRLNTRLRAGLGSSLFGVQRQSLGEIYFTLSIVLVYLLHTSIAEYLAPLLVLTFADSAAALVGCSYGRHELAGEHEDRKSYEGSVMFFITAFICVLTPLQLLTDVGRAEVLMISFMIGLLAAMVEMVSQNGNDNLLLPLLVYSFLRYNMNQPMRTLLLNFAIMLCFLAALICVYKLTAISKLALAYALLTAYVILIQGGFLWILPPLLMFLTFRTLPLPRPEEKLSVVPWQIVDANAFVGLVCLWLAVFFPQMNALLYAAYSLSFACHLTLDTYHRFVNYLHMGRARAWACGLGKALCFIAAPTYIAAHTTPRLAALYAAALVAVIPAAALLRSRFNFAEINVRSARANEALVACLVALFIILAF
ncbi:MAG: hypothetical protein LBL37_00630 [Gracilibacteraceae bacterium]|nr:hypothetical protein [Gracilibacteraceae bacterium]